jgi:hypothetical protein
VSQVQFLPWARCDLARGERENRPQADQNRRTAEEPGGRAGQRRPHRKRGGGGARARGGPLGAERSDVGDPCNNTLMTQAEGYCVCVRKWVSRGLVAAMLLLAGCTSSSSSPRPYVRNIAASNAAVCHAVDSFVGNSGLVVTSADKEQALAEQLKKLDDPEIASSKLRSEIPGLTRAINASPASPKELQDALNRMLDTCTSVGYPISITASGSS